MNFRAAVFALLACTATGAQQATPPSKPRAPSLHWLVEGTQDLGLEDRLRITKQLNRSERAALIKAIVAQSVPDGKPGGPQAEKDAIDAAKETRIRLIDLNGDVLPEVIAQATGAAGGCSPTGNCPLWVFERTLGGYKLILDGDSFQNFAVRPKRTNGFNDLVLGMHGSAFEQELHVFKFRDGWYRQDACYDAAWQKLVGDEWQDLKEPIITPCKNGR